METKSLRLWSYTRAAKDADCPRARYYSREFGGTGIVPMAWGWDLVFGNLIHKGLQDLATTGSIDYTAYREKIRAEGMEQFGDPFLARDWAGLGEGLLVGFARSVWPNLMAEYAVIEAEKWIEWEVQPGYLFRARQDLLLENRFDKHLCYVDFKTTSSTTAQWVTSWAKSPQLHSSMYAFERSTGKAIQNGLILGLYKGYKDKKNNNTPRSVLNYGYVNRQFQFTPEYSVEYKKSKGWELFSVLDEFQSIEPWIGRIEPPKLSEQFPQTAPIFPRNDIAEAYFRQQMIREREVEHAVEALHDCTTVEGIRSILDTYFRQNFDKCDPHYGFKCEFMPICWTPWIQADPLGSGQFKPYESDLE